MFLQNSQRKIEEEFLKLAEKLGAGQGAAEDDL